MRVPHLVISGSFLAISVVVALMSLQLGFYTGSEPGPGLLPFGVAILLGGLSLLGLFRATTAPSEPLPPDFLPSWIGLLRIVAIIVALLGTMVLMKPLGFRITMLAFLVFLLFVLGRQKPIVTLLVSLAGSFGIFFLFTSWLRVPLPTGMFGF